MEYLALHSGSTHLNTWEVNNTKQTQNKLTQKGLVITLQKNPEKQADRANNLVEFYCSP